ncbi:MAG: GumC family protein [Flavobacteriaceae bacterium]
MKKRKTPKINRNQEVNLKLLLERIYRHRIIFLASIGLFLLIAYAYIKLSTPVYEVSTSILIDPKGSNRVLGESEYVDGGVSLIEMEKNLYNEIGIIKSFSLIDETVRDLGFDLTYHSGNWMQQKEHYGYFPFKVTLLRNEPQTYNVPFKVTLLANDRYRLSVNASDFRVSNPANGTIRGVDKSIDHTKVYSFGEKVAHPYFNFVINKPDYEVNTSDFRKSELSFTVQDFEAVANGYMNKLEVDNIDVQASIFKIVSYGPVVSKEVDFLKKLTENYVQDKLKSRDKIASSKETFIRNQLRLVSDSLLRVEADLESFKKDKRAVNLSATAINALDQTQNLQMERAKMEMDIEYNNSLIDYVENNSGSDDFAIPTSTGIEDPQVSENITELKRLHAERSRKKFFLTENNQEMQVLNSQIEEATSNLLNDLKSANRSSQFALQGLRGQIGRYSGVISSLPTREKQLLGIQRQSNLYENLFNYLSQELAKTGIAKAESVTDTRVLDEARMMGDEPVAPNKKVIMALALLAGAFLPMVWMLGFAPNDIIHHSGQILANSDIPLIASISYYDSKSKKRGSELALWKVKESFRDLYANLRLIDSKKDCTVLGLTSIMPEEGKTYCAINLGITLAEADKKTLIIDMDLRKPSLVEGIKKVEGRGLSNYLQGEIDDLNKIIYPHESLSKLNYIPTAVAEGNIHELLSGDKIKELLSRLKERYDYIILDTPAVGLVSDFLLFRDEVDINLFVLRRKIAKTGFLEDLESLISREKKKKSYIIYNDTLERDFKYGYGQKYGVNRETQLINETLSV